MRILVIGGTRFLGRSVGERLLGDEHEITLLNRGESGPGLFPGVPRIISDRRELTPETFGDRYWDAVLDMNAYYPSEIATTFVALRGHIGRYVLCSTGSVYADIQPYPVAEDAPMESCTPEQAADTSTATYGARKAECERLLTRLGAEDGIPVFIGRPVVVYGPYDYTDRMHFWLEAVRRGHVVLPGDGTTIFHTVYVHDLARLFATMATTDAARAGVYNVASTELRSLRDLVDDIAAVVGTQPEVVHAPAARLNERGVKAQLDLPLWIPDTNVIMDISRAKERLGFRATPFRETLRATLDAYVAQPRVPLETVMDPDALWRLAHEA